MDIKIGVFIICKQFHKKRNYYSESLCNISIKKYCLVLKKYVNNHVHFYV